MENTCQRVFLRFEKFASETIHKINDMYNSQDTSIPEGMTQEEMTRAIYCSVKEPKWPDVAHAVKITTAEVAWLTGLSEKTIERMRQRGEIPFEKRGRKCLYPLLQLMYCAADGAFSKNESLTLSAIFRKHLIERISVKTREDLR